MAWITADCRSSYRITTCTDPPGEPSACRKTPYCISPTAPTGAPGTYPEPIQAGQPSIAGLQVLFTTFHTVSGSASISTAALLVTGCSIRRSVVHTRSSFGGISPAGHGLRPASTLQTA